MSLKLYGVPLSQPFRSVSWALLQKQIPFKVALTVPGMKTKNGARHPDFLAKAPLGAVPVIEEEDGFAIEESAAILTYLAETRSDALHDLYPTTARARARISSFMHWHHSGTRQLAMLVQPYFRPDLGRVGEDVIAKREDAARSILDTLSTVWLSNSPFIGGSHTATIADLLAYEEVVQLPMLNLLSIEDPNIMTWMDRMKLLPGHEAAHAALAELGDLRSPLDSTPIAKRLGGATKAGMQAIAEAQQASPRP